MLAFNAHFDDGPGAVLQPRELDPKTLALVRLAVLVAVGGAVPSFGAQADAAVRAGATAVEIVDVLMGVLPMVGLLASSQRRRSLRSLSGMTSRMPWNLILVHDVATR